jgi:hypothetical protein
MVWDMLKNQDHDLQSLKSDKSLKKFPFNEQLLKLCTECWQRRIDLEPNGQQKKENGAENSQQKKENGTGDAQQKKKNVAGEEKEGHMLDLKLQVNS